MATDSTAGATTTGRAHASCRPFGGDDAFSVPQLTSPEEGPHRASRPIDPKADDTCCGAIRLSAGPNRVDCWSATRRGEELHRQGGYACWSGPRLHHAHNPRPI